MEDTARLALVEQSLRSSETFDKVMHELFHCINCILEDPHDYDLRTINSDIIKREMKSEALRDYLKYIGFEMRDGKMTYPKEQTLSKLRIAQAAIQRKITFCSGPFNVDQVQFPLWPNRSSIQTKKPKLLPLNVLDTKNPLLLKIESIFNNMIKYEDEDLQKRALNVIPVVTLQLMAIDRVREHQQKLKSGVIKTRDLPFDIALLMELLGWFKHKFFKWVDKPECERCGATTRFVGTTNMRTETENCIVEEYACARCGSDFQPRAPQRPRPRPDLYDDWSFATNQLCQEHIVYQCNKCNGGARFPRYNCPRALLRSRRGRCGEWANCFTLLCRALGYDTRYIYDTTDHVWCEVFDYDSNTWLHVDPCEAKLNAPLLYSHGWGKKLNYVIAVSRDDVQDVTWRYTTNHKEVLKRRNLCNESELMEAIMTLRERRQRQVSEARRRYLAKRCAEELAQMLVERKPSDYESHGRISGSKEWRTERGETGAALAAGHTFVFSGSGNVSVGYYPAEDEYQISGPNMSKDQVIKTWNAGVFASKNMFRKVEEDWQKVYLAREESDSPGYVSWHMRGEGAEFTSLCVRASTATFHGGLVVWTVCFDDEKPTEVDFGDLPLRFERRFSKVEICAEVSGGRGELAWQHSQLFRASSDSASVPTPAFVVLATIEARPS